MLNDAGGDEFDNQIEDEDGSIYPPPGVEIGALKLAVDRGSGSYAEDGRLEVAEDRVMADGEAQVGSAAMYGPTEIGQYAEDGASEIGHGWFPGDGASEIGAGLASEDGQSEIGYNPYAIDGASEIGQYAEDGASEIGQYAEDGASEIGAGLASEDGQSEIGYGWAPGDGQSEIGVDVQSPFESFMLDDVHMGDWSPEQGYVGAVAKVVEQARDNRQPPPPLRAVDTDAQSDWPDNWTQSLTDVVLGAAEATGHPDPFPLTSQFMLRCGAGMEPRYVRVDTEASYKQFRQESSPELQELKDTLEAHIADASAHGGGVTEEPWPANVDPEDIVMLGAEVQAAEKEKQVELYMPKHFDGQVTAWREGDSVCSSMRIPGYGGETRICTTLEPLQKCIDEMSRHAAESGAPVTAIGHLIPAMGCVLGAGTGLKEMAAAAPSIATRPEMKTSGAFMVRIEPKTNPALCALAMLAMAAKEGVPGASDEWANLAALSPAPIKQAMGEAVVLAKAAEAR